MEGFPADALTIPFHLAFLWASTAGVPRLRGVWMRNDLQTRHHRLLRLEETVRKRKIKLTDEQIQALERFDPEYRERHIQVNATGELVAVDTFFAGTLKGVGKVYIQTVLDCFSRFVWARLYTSKMPVTAVQILNNHALPFFEEHDLKVQSSSCNSRRSNTAPRRSAGPSRTASSSDSTGRSSKNTSESRAARPGTRRLRRCRRTWMLTWRPTTARGRTAAAA